MASIEQRRADADEIVEAIQTSCYECPRRSHHADLEIEKVQSLLDLCPDRRWREREDWKGLLHEVCNSKYVTLEIVESLLDACPDAATIMYAIEADPVYPLSLACRNPLCPGSVVKLLAAKHPSALECEADESEDLGYGGAIEGVSRGWPLHLYLERECDIELDVIKCLAGFCPKAITTPACEIFRLCPSPNCLGGDSFLIHRSVTVDETLQCPRYDLMRYLIECDPSTVYLKDGLGRTPLHLACLTDDVDIRLIRLLLQYGPAALREQDKEGRMPLHYFCLVRQPAGETETTLDVLALLADDHAVRHHENEGFLPIHRAAEHQSPEFYRFLFERYPQSLEIGVDPRGRWSKWWSIEYVESDGNYVPGMLPLHVACQSESSSFEVVKDLLAFYPDAVCIMDNLGHLPMQRVGEYDDASKKDFCQSQLEKAMVRPDGNGQLLLHRTVANPSWTWRNTWKHNQDCTDVKTIELLLEANPSATQVVDCNGALPFHIACEFSPRNCVVEFLEGRFDDCLHLADKLGNYPLHYACRGGNHRIVNYLLDKQTPAVSLTNYENKLPIQLFCESIQETGSVDHVATIYRLLLADPQTVEYLMLM